jgi:hypothetical protein
MARDSARPREILRLVRCCARDFPSWLARDFVREPSLSRARTRWRIRSFSVVGVDGGVGGGDGWVGRGGGGAGSGAAIVR